MNNKKAKAIRKEVKKGAGELPDSMIKTAIKKAKKLYYKTQEK